MFPNIVSLLELSWLSNSLPFFSSCSFPGFMNSHLVHDIQSWYSNKHLRNPMQISGVLAELLFPDWFYCSIIQSFPTLHDPMDCSTWVFLVLHPSQSLLKLISIELVMTSNHLILCHLFLILPSIFPSIRVFSNESVLHIRWPKFGVSYLVLVLFFSTFSQILSSSYWITQAWKYAFTQAYSHYPLYSSIVLLSPPPSFIHTHRGRRIFATKRKVKITRNRLQGVNIEGSKFTNTTEQWFMPKN